MSATPRPWAIDWGEEKWGEGGEVWGIAGPDHKHVVETDMGHYPPRRDDAILIVRAVNAFDALLAVAKAADSKAEDYYGEDKLGRIARAVEMLDAAHPDWRTWT